MLSVAFASVILFFATVTSAQQLISPTLPSCAQQCGILTQAQTACIPPAAPVTDQGTYLSCFCQSNFLKPVYGPPGNYCPTCSSSDNGIIQNWFKGQCGTSPGAAAAAPAANNVNGGSNNNNDQNAKPTTSSTTAVAKPTTNADQGTSTVAGGVDKASKKSWYETSFAYLSLVNRILGFQRIGNGSSFL